MAATAQRRREAQRQANLVARINRQSSKFVKVYANAIKQATLQAAKQDKKLVIPDKAIDVIVNELVGFSIFAYITGLKDAKATVKRLSLASSFDSRVSTIAKGFDINIGTLSKQMRSIVAPNVRESLHSVRKRINDTLSELSADKIPTKQATRLLTRRLNEMGVTPTNKAYVETLVRTHGQLAWGAAQAKEFEEDEDLWGYEYVTVGDDRVREDHEKLDGLIRKKDDPIWKTIFPPNGYNCRCQVLAIYEPVRQTPVPAGATDLVDPGFRFNPGKELG
jgi:SPP1 gp7 family putative phage head morphogenesis protein